MYINNVNLDFYFHQDIIIIYVVELIVEGLHVILIFRYYTHFSIKYCRKTVRRISLIYIIMSAKTPPLLIFFKYCSRAQNKHTLHRMHGLLVRAIR